MKRLLQSGFGVGLLLLLVVIAIVNTAQLHNIEARVAGIEKSGVKVSGGTPEPVAATAPIAARADGICHISPEDQTGAADPGNLLRPFRAPEGWPDTIASTATLKRHIASEPPGMNLIASNNAADLSEMYRYITARVAYQSPTNPDDWHPELAYKITESADGLTYDVYLRKGVLWHKPAVDLSDARYAWLNKPHEVTADDFAFALEMVQNPQVMGRASALRTYYDGWSPIEVVDPYHFRVRVKEKLYTNRQVLLDMAPMPRWLYRYDEDGQAFDETTWGDKVNSHWYNQKGIGVGMYRFVEWQQGVRMLLERNPDWFAAPCRPANFERVDIAVIKDQQAWLRNLKTHNIDYTVIQPQQYKSEVEGKTPYLGESGLKLKIHDEASYFYFGWNQARPMFQDKRVRRAMTLAMDREGLVKSVFAGLGSVTSGPFDQANPCYDHSIKPLPYDLEEARRLLTEAGWTDSDGDGTLDKVIDGKKVPFAFTMVVYGSSAEYETLARVYRDALSQLGIKMTAQPLEWSAQLKKIGERDFDAYSGAWVPTWEVDLYQIWHSSEADKPESSNYVGFRNPEGDRIAFELRREFDPQKRTELCHAFHALVHEEQPYTFFYQRKRPMLYWDYMNEPVISRLNPHRDVRLLSFATLPE